MVVFFLSDKSTLADKTAASIITHTGMSLSSDVYILIESEGVGIDFDNLSKVVNNYTIGTCIGFNVLNSLIFMVLGIYLD